MLDTCFGVAHQSVHFWLLRYEDFGMPDLMYRSRRPSGCENPMAAEVEVVLRRRNVFWSPRRIQPELARFGVTPVPSVPWRSIHARKRMIQTAQDYILEMFLLVIWTAI